MKLGKKLKSPLALVAQGFVAGAVLFFTVAPPGGDSSPPRSSGGSMLANLQA